MVSILASIETIVRAMVVGHINRSERPCESSLRSAVRGNSSMISRARAGARMRDNERPTQGGLRIFWSSTATSDEHITVVVLNEILEIL